MYKGDTKTIRVSLDTYENLERLGTLADSFDTVIQKLLASYIRKGSVLTSE
jgi:predicted CopG family antitoxin